MEFSTIHIFKYGEAQIISEDLNFKSNVSNFKKLQPVIDIIKSNRPKNVDDKEYHIINIVKEKADYNSLEKGGSFSVKIADLDSKKIDALVLEFETLKIADDKAKADKAKADAKNK